MRKFLSLAIAGGMLLPSAVFASELGNYRSEHVSYSDLDLLKATDRKVLDRRLVAATRTVCRLEIETEIFATNEQRRCIKQTLADARSRANQAFAFQQAKGASGILLAAK